MMVNNSNIKKKRTTTSHLKSLKTKQDHDTYRCSLVGPQNIQLETKYSLDPRYKARQWLLKRVAHHTVKM